MSVRYKANTITPVDAVLWTGANFVEVQELCPEVIVGPEAAPWILTIPGNVTVSLNEYLMKEIGTGKYSKLTADTFNGLYTIS
jgi:hypothetical protein